MEQIKALFFDVDSTLYTHRVHDLPASTKDLLIKAKKKDTKLGLRQADVAMKQNICLLFLENIL